MIKMFKKPLKIKIFELFLTFRISILTEFPDDFSLFWPSVVVVSPTET